MKKIYTEKDVLAAARFGWDYAQTSQDGLNNTFNKGNVLQWLQSYNENKDKKLEQEEVFYLKYFPVKDDKAKIEVDDLFIFKINNKWTEPCEFDSFLGPDIQDVKRVKLFLCSDNIKENQWVYYYNPHPSYNWASDIYIVVKVDDRIEAYRNDNENNTKHSFNKSTLSRIIGVVSSKINWVKEGDIFTKHELALISDTGDDEIFPFDKMDDEDFSDLHPDPNFTNSIAILGYKKDFIKE